MEIVSKARGKWRDWEHKGARRHPPTAGSTAERNANNCFGLTRIWLPTRTPVRPVARRKGGRNRAMADWHFRQVADLLQTGETLYSYTRTAQLQAIIPTHPSRNKSGGSGTWSWTKALGLPSSKTSKVRYLGSAIRLNR